MAHCSRCGQPVGAYDPPHVCPKGTAMPGDVSPRYYVMRARRPLLSIGGALIVLVVCALAAGAIAWTEWQSRRAKQDVSIPVQGSGGGYEQASTALAKLEATVDRGLTEIETRVRALTTENARLRARLAILERRAALEAEYYRALLREGLIPITVHVKP